MLSEGFFIYRLTSNIPGIILYPDAKEKGIEDGKQNQSSGSKTRPGWS